MGLTNNLGKLSNMITSTGSAVGIGTASPAVLLDVNGHIRLADGYELQYGGTSATIYGSSTNNQLRMYTSNTERMRITSTGNVGIGSSTPQSLLEVRGATPFIRITDTASSSDTGLIMDVGGGFIRGGLTINSSTGEFKSFCGVAGNTYYQTFLVNGTERMRITSGGFIGFGVTPNRPVVASYSVSGSVMEIINTRNSSSNDYALVTALGSNANNTSSYHYIASTGGADKYYLYGNGTYTTVSDIRLKKNISKVTDTYLDKVLGLNIVNYNWNEQEDGHPLEFGMIAQEVEELIPSIVHEGREQEDGNIYKGIQASVLPYILIKAIQEQQEIINELSAKVTALENK